MSKGKKLMVLGSGLLSMLLVLSAIPSYGVGKPSNTPQKEEKKSPQANENSQSSKPGTTSNPPSNSSPKSNPSTENKIKSPGINSNPKARVQDSEVTENEVSCDTQTKQKTKAEGCNNFIVVFNPGSSASVRKSAISAAGSKIVREYNSIFKGALINGPASKMSALSKNPNVKYLEADGTVKSTILDNSPTWGLDRIDQKMLPLNSTFDDGDKNGAGFSAYVVDTGINSQHAEFATRVGPGFSALSGGIEDCNGHGTHVGGIIGGNKYGVARGVTLIPVRVLDCSGSGSYSSVIAGLDWIAANAPAGTPAVVNMSLGGGASSTLDTAVKNLIARGFSVVVAAGNSSTDACTSSPARVVEAITVGATTNLDQRASYSNFGTCLDIFAPGSAITSSWIGSTTASNTISGTSMASPLVAGVVARFIANNPTLSPSQVASSLKSGATQNVLTSVGTGSLNLLAHLDFIFDGSPSTQPIDVPQTTLPGNSGSSKKPNTGPGKKK